jgi:hypothetical protein
VCQSESILLLGGSRGGDGSGPDDPEPVKKTIFYPKMRAKTRPEPAPKSLPGAVSNWAGKTLTKNDFLVRQTARAVFEPDFI